jgi:two-component system alkaline phosphatase synthesis response regulator PhoP|tara:strand:+ start:1900 stop:2622 length:723 start_codon:yes stop_codon:yes gene_type:complete
LPEILLSHSDHKILVIEDDRILREALRYNLVAAGYEVVVASDGGEGLVSARQSSPDVVVLDLMLPSLSGMEVCKALRRDGSILPIIMLTARDSEIDRIGGLESGADDYVTKPFSMRELIARVTAQIRRMQMIKSISQNATDEILDLGELVINRASRNVTLNGKSVDLRPREFDLLTHMAANPGRVYTRDQLLHDVWGFEYIGDTRTVDVHVRWLRLKIEEDPARPKILGTVRGVGYRINV